MIFSQPPAASEAYIKDDICSQNLNVHNLKMSQKLICLKYYVAAIKKYFILLDECPMNIFIPTK